MSAKLIELRTVQQYKQFAQSTQQLNEALNNEIRQCYYQIDSLRADLKRANEGHLSRDTDIKLLNEYQNKVAELESRNQIQQSELFSLKNHSNRIENELKNEQQHHQIKSRLLQKAEDELNSLRQIQRETDKKLWQMEQRNRQLETSNVSKSIMTESRKQEKLTLEESSHRVVTLQSKLKSLESQLKRSQEDNVWLKQLVADKATLQQMLLKQVSSVTNERMAIEKTCKEHEVQFTRLRHDISQLKQQLSAAKIELRESQAKFQHQQAKCRRLAQDAQQFKNKSSQRDQYVLKLQATIKQLSEKASQHDTQTLKDRVRQLSQQLTLKTQSICQFQDQIEKLAEHIGKLETAQNNNQEEDMEMAANEIINLHRQLNEIKNSNQQLREENKKLKNMDERSVNGDTSTLKLSNSATRLETSRLRGQYSEAVRKNNTLIEANARLEIAKNELIKELEAVKKQNVPGTPNSEVHDLRLRLAQANQQLDQLNKTLNEKQNDRFTANSFKSSMKTIESRKKWRDGSFDIQRQPRAPNDHWINMQKKIDNLRSQNEMLRRDLSFGNGQWHI